MSEYAESILRSLRRISRAIDRYSRHLSAHHQLTGPQTVCLRVLLQAGPRTPGALAAEASLSQATVTGILDRLEAKGLVVRTRDARDRRRVLLALTDAGRAVAEAAPSPLQADFAERLRALPRERQAALDAALREVMTMMEGPPGEAGVAEGVPADRTLSHPPAGALPAAPGVTHTNGEPPGADGA